MSLSCECDYYDDYEYYFNPPKDFIKFEQKRRERCCSCSELIEISADCGVFETYELDEYGDKEIKPDKFMCEGCAGLYFALEDLGFCMTLGDNMHNLVYEYNQEFS